MSKEQLTAIHKHLTSALGTVQVMLDQLAEPPAEEPEPPVDEPPAEEPPTEEPPVEEPPAPPPATPRPPATNDDLVDGLGTGATPCGSSGAPDVAQCRDPGVIVTADTVQITQNMPKFNWDIGTRKMVLSGIVDVMSVMSVGGLSGQLPLIWCKPGGGFGIMEYSSIIGLNGSMVLKQEQGGLAGEITRCDIRGMSQDALKVCGGNLIHENAIADAEYKSGVPHSDVLTAMSADGGISFLLNYVNWNYANRSDQSGINNWARIEAYGAYSGIYDDILIEGNALRHANARSMAIQFAGSRPKTWRGSVMVRNNRMQKAGGLHKILYAPSSHITDWSGNTDFAGNPIDYSAT